MRNYTEFFKKELVKKRLLDLSKPASRFAKEAGIADSTLSAWIKKYRERPIDSVTKAGRGSDNWTNEERFNILIESSRLPEEQLGSYCRRRGIYQHQLSDWKDEFMNKKEQIRDARRSSELKAVKAENKALKKELRRKDKALAETSALLILKKKAELLWGELGDD